MHPRSSQVMGKAKPQKVARFPRSKFAPGFMGVLSI